MNAFAWLNDLMSWIGRFFPRLVLVQASHEGVRFDPGGRVTRLHPGLHLFWPIAQNVVLVSVAQRSLNLAAQLLGTEIVSLVIIYTITDAVLVATKLYNFAAQLEAHARAALQGAYRPEVRSDVIGDAVADVLRAELTSHGLYVASVAVTQRGWVLPLKQLQDWAEHEAVELQ